MSPIPSDPEPGGRAATGLPLHLPRRIRPWRYQVGHSELTLRSVDRVPAGEVVEATFFGVVGMKLKTTYEGIALREAGHELAREIARFAGIRSDCTDRLRCLLLDPEADDSFVACVGFSVWTHRETPESDRSGMPRDGSTLILRG
ncbi:hypothetical protein [Yinghuangia soli]|uniref:Uncharacterized protein n=1 Tax=Yinghuangia soli TaxID=2908204 RepID=A0AA41U146_9ACTN|nr:hypothetical protein [Yinghuangia soli]MCF2525764.1 hypothetical protein [Yinghuangia soli]